MHFTIIIDCNIEQANVILEYAKTKFHSNFVILTDSQLLKNKFNETGRYSETILDNIPTDSLEEIQVYERAYENTRVLGKYFSKLTYQGIGVFSIFQNRVNDELIFLEKISHILHKKTEYNVVLCLSAYNYYNLACLDVASLLGYQIQPPLTISENELEVINPLTIADNRLIFSALYKENKTNDEKPLETQFALIEQGLQITSDKRSCIFLLQTNAADLYLNPVYPIIEEFQHQHYPFLIMARETRTRNILHEKKISFVDYSEYIDKTLVSDEVVNNILKLTKTIAMKKDAVNIISFCRYLLNDAFYLELTEKCKLVKLFSSLLVELRPVSIFVMPDVTDDAEILCSIAKQNEIMSVTTIAASVAPHARAISHHAAEVIACYGGECVDAFEKMGYKGRVVPTGNPFYDRVKKDNFESIKSNLYTKYKIDFEKPVILIATSGYDKNESEWMLETIRIANKMNYEIIIKIHPDLKLDNYQDLVNNNDLKFHFLQDADISELLATSSVVITDYSNVGVGAILFDKPLIVVNLLKQPFPNNRFDEYGVALLATSVNELSICLHKILSDKEIQSQLKKHRTKYEYFFNYKNDGNAASRIFELLTAQRPKSVFSRMKGMIK